MKFYEVVEQVIVLLQREGRVSYRALKREFDLDEEFLEDLKGELITAKRLASDEDGKVLVWGGREPKAETENRGNGESEKKPNPSSHTTPSTLDARRNAAERRQLTVMFCDLVDSTALSARLDPEEWREVVHTYHRVSAEAIDHFEGHIAQHLGDGLLVYFGYPSAHEDDAQRAVRAGLGIVAAIQQAPLLQHHGVQVRLGIHTGLVVVGDVGTSGRYEQLALGDAPNIAARLQGLAVPNTVIVSAATQRLVAGFFDYHDGGLQSVKGVSAPLQVYWVLSESRAQSRLEVEVSAGRLTPLVGRAHEVGLLLGRWTAAQAGDGQVVLLNGEAGIGKSRLVQEVKEHVVRQGAICLEFRCSPYSQNSALYPIITHLQRVLQVERDDPPQAKLAKLQQTLTRYHFPQADTLSLLAALLSLPPPENAPPLTLSPQKQKQKTQEALAAWLAEEAERTSVYCVWEDLHWADPSTLELLGLLLDQVSTARLLVLLTARPEFTPPWSSRMPLTPLSLERLPHTQAGEMIEKVTGGKGLPAEVQHQIVNKTDGVPLFVEELTKLVLESGLLREIDGQYALTAPLPPLAIPTTLHDSLMARLDRLSSVREVAQLGAMLGREFSYELLHAVSPLNEHTLQNGLTQLVEAELLYPRGIPPHATYIFKHALIQDTAYQSLLKSKRQQLHQQVARILEGQFADLKETQPELLAYHYTEAGLTEQAIPYWQQAGERAASRSANNEASNHLTKGLDLLKTLPHTPELVRQELVLQTTLGPVLMAAKGYAVPEVERAYVRARELCQQIGETPQLCPVLHGLWGFYIVRAEYRTAYELGEQLLSLAESQQDTTCLIAAHWTLGASSFLLGELAAARAHLEQSLALYNLREHRSLAFVYGHDPGMSSLSFAALSLWQLGYPDQALKSSQAAVSLAREVAHPFSLAYALVVAAWCYQLRREGQKTKEQAEAGIALSTEHGVPMLLAMSTIFRGWALVEQGQGEEGVAQICQGLTAFRVSSGGEGLRPHLLAVLAEAYGRMEQAAEGLSAVSEALTLVNRTGERSYEAELYRLKGELTLQQEKQRAKSNRQKKLSVVSSPLSVTSPQLLTPSPQSEAETCFLKAIDIARQQQAESLELRATMSLSRLWQQQGKQEQARQLLAPIYTWFTEGFATADLKEAKALLEELADC